MLSFRSVLSLIWSLSAFVLAAALALHLRYRPLADQPAYLDTWTGEVRGAVSDTRVSAGTVVPSIALGPGPAEALAERLRLEIRRLPRRETVEVGPCPSVRFAFPAPESR